MLVPASPNAHCCNPYRYQRPSKQKTRFPPRQLKIPSLQFGTVTKPGSLRTGFGSRNAHQGVRKPSGKHLGHINKELSRECLPGRGRAVGARCCPSQAVQFYFTHRSLKICNDNENVNAVRATSVLVGLTVKIS